MSVPLALVDLIPVILFAASAVILQKDLHGKMSPVCFGLLAGGSIMIIFAGLYKVIWKLLYCMGVCDFRKLSDCMFPIQAPGFVLMAIALVIMLASGKKRKNTLAAVSAAPALYTGTMIFVVMNCLGLAVVCTALSIIAVKLKKKKLIILFVLCFIVMLAMGYLSSKDFEQAIMNWIAEFDNFIGQALLLTGVCSLHKAGLKDLEL